MNPKAKWIEVNMDVPAIYDLAICPEFKREFDLAAVPASVCRGARYLGRF